MLFALEHIHHLHKCLLVYYYIGRNIVVKIKSIITAVVAAFMTIMQPISANAADTANKSIAVITAEDLASVTGNGTYYIYQDIDLEGFDWKGISDFSGTLLAYNHSVIKNMSSDDCGLFRKLSSGAMIKNIHLENANIKTNTKMLGGLVSYIPASSKGVEITDCSVNGMVRTIYEGSSTINYCGGIAGVVAAKDCVISGCSSAAYVGGVLGEGGIVGLNYGKINDCAFTGRIQNVKNAPSEDPDEVKEDIYYISFASGGISGVNYGSINNSAVLLSDCDSAQYLGLISGVNIKRKGTIKNCVALGVDRWSDGGDSENFNSSANVVKSKIFSKTLKSWI